MHKRMLGSIGKINKINKATKHIWSGNSMLKFRDTLQEIVHIVSDLVPFAQAKYFAIRTHVLNSLQE